MPFLKNFAELEFYVAFFRYNVRSIREPEVLTIAALQKTSKLKNQSIIILIENLSETESISKIKDHINIK